MNRESILLLRSEKDPVGTLGSYNAYCQKGERFKSLWLGAPATVTYDSTKMLIKTLEKDRIISNVFQKENTNILWVGYSGRMKDYLTWLLIKDNEKAFLVSNFFGENEASTEEYAAELFYALSDLGYNVGLENKRRGLFLQLFGLISIAAIAISQISSANFGTGLFLMVLVCIIALVTVFSKSKLPKR